jgi:hypothetical protein
LLLLCHVLSIRKVHDEIANGKPGPGAPAPGGA